MSIDLVQELNVRAVAHNIALRFSEGADADDVAHYALRLANLMQSDDALGLATAGIAMWRTARQKETAHVHA